MWSQQYTSEEAVQLFTQAGISGGIVRTIADLRHDPHLEARHHIVQIPVPGVGNLPYFASPFRMGESCIDYMPAPALGADTDQILNGYLGMSVEEIACLRQEGVVG